ncbi:KAP family P-loop domain protein [Clostridium perfringens B str. ATCC 3626]|uniref:KAP family P-loop domain protein n=2 Tax=Clostridium perfringens TaxID=1502 RepID=A0AAV3BLK0_CLOPF|nr:P-loop NTPase fold protein [Clostridium perfringens]EDT23195.1 KAP family P-loop domain protein [Clostridium perfringens B str. ATCC 3626]
MIEKSIKFYNFLEKNILLELWSLFWIFITYQVLSIINIKEGIVYNFLYLINKNSKSIFYLMLLIFLGEFLFKYRKNFLKFLKITLKYYIPLSCSIFAIKYYFIHNIINPWFLLFIVLLVLNSIINSKQFNKFLTQKRNKENNNSLDENICESYEELFPTRQKQVDNIINYIDSFRINSRFTLLLNGQWGAGKTSLINSLEKRYEEMNKKEKINIIFIQPMMFDKKDLLVDYFCERLKELFIEGKIYVGNNSNVENYLNSLLKWMDKKTGTDIQHILNLGSKETDDFRKIKKSLQNDIYKYTYNFGRIIVVVDDFDRVEAATIKEILMFIRELIDFNGINTILLMQYSKIINEDNGLTKEYLDKYIDYRIELNKVDFKEILITFFNKALNSNDMKDLSKSNADISEVLNLFKNNIDLLVKNINQIKNFSSFEYKKDKETNSEIDIIYNQITSNINNSLTNVRVIKKIVKETCLSYKKLQKNCNDFILDEEDLRFIFKFIYIKNIFIDEYNYIANLNSFHTYYEDFYVMSYSTSKREPIEPIKEIFIRFFNEISNKEITEIKKINRFHIANAILKNAFNNIDYETDEKFNEFAKYIDQTSIQNIEDFNFVYGHNHYNISFDNLREFYNSIKLKYLEDINLENFKKRIAKLNKLSLELSKREENLDELLRIYNYYGINSTWFNFNNDFINDIYDLLKNSNLKSTTFPTRMMEIRKSKNNIFSLNLHILININNNYNKDIKVINEISELFVKLQESMYQNTEDYKSYIKSLKYSIGKIKLKDFEIILSEEEFDRIISNINKYIELEEVLFKVEDLFNNKSFTLDNVNLDNVYSILNKIKTFEEFNELSSYILKLILNPEYNLVQVKDIRLIRRLIDDSTKFSKENYNIKPLLILLDEVFNKINKFKNHFDEETFKSYVLMKIDFEILKKSYEKLDKKET